MSFGRWVIDTNVPIVANGRVALDEVAGPPSLECRLAAVEFLNRMHDSGTVVVDAAGEIQAEYRKHLLPSGEPGVGDRFYQMILLSSPQQVQRVPLAKTGANFDAFPESAELAGFDLSDRKFAALALQENIPVCNAVDSDWVNFKEGLEEAGLVIRFVCGTDVASWFVST
jgi:hypothetical protein